MDILKELKQAVTAAQSRLDGIETATGLVTATVEESTREHDQLSQDIQKLTDTEHAVARHGDRRAVKKAREAAREMVVRREVIDGEIRRDKATIAELTQEHAEAVTVRKRALMAYEDALAAAFMSRAASVLKEAFEPLIEEYKSLRTTAPAGAVASDWHVLTAHALNFFGNHLPREVETPVTPKPEIILLRNLLSFGGYAQGETSGWSPEDAALRLAMRADVAVGGDGSVSPGEPVFELVNREDANKLPELPGQPRGWRVGLTGLMDAGTRAIKSVGEVFGKEGSE
jgi:hypothetical protein